MKRTIVALLLVAALAAPAFGQDLGSIDLGQGWINPNNASNDLLPESMLAFVSNGFYMDEIDTIARAPLLFGDFTGYSVFTAYGNYESWNGAGITEIAPFVPGAYAVGNYQLGLAMPVPGFDDWRSGVLFGMATSHSGDLRDVSAGLTDQFYLEGSDTDVVDSAVEIGVADYTTVTAYKATDKTTSKASRFVGALNLGWLGVSLYGTASDDTRSLGGEFTYTRTEGTNADTTTRVANSSTYWGSSAIGKDLAGTDASGKAKSIPVDQSMTFGAIGQMSLLGMPISASLNFKTIANDTAFTGGDYDTVMPQRVYSTQIYAADASVTKINTYEVLQGVNLSGGTDWDPTAMGTLPAATTANYSSGLTAAIDLSESGKGGFYSGLGFAVDPTFSLSDNVSLKPRAALGYSLGILNKKETRVAYGAYTLAQPGTTADTTWEYSSTQAVIASGTEHDLRGQLGTALSLHSADEKVELISGFYALPYLESSITTPKSSTLTIDRSYSMVGGTVITSTAADATGSAAAAAALIGSADTITGTSHYSMTTTGDGSTSTTETGVELAVPVAVRLNFFDKKLSVVGGLNATCATSVTTVHTRTTSLTTSETVTLTDGTTAVTFTPPTASVANDYPEETISKSYSDTAWAGNVDFMFRWTPNETITVDMTGTSVKAAFGALNGFFSLNGGIIPSKLWDFVDALALSVTFHF